MSEGDRIEPRWDIHGVPRCTEGCPSHDGKRCTILGARPEGICEPAVSDALTELKRLRELPKTTDRGFRIYGELTVVHGVRVRVVESSADPLAEAHVFAKDERSAYEHRTLRLRGHEVCNAPIAVNVEQAEELIRALQAFIAHKRGT